MITTWSLLPPSIKRAVLLARNDNMIWEKRKNKRTGFEAKKEGAGAPCEVTLLR